MPTQRKIDSVAEITERLQRAKSLVVTDYRGLTVEHLQDLRRRLRAAGVEFVVVKNTLARRAADAVDLGALKEELVGPAGLAIGYDDPIAAPRVVNDYIKQTRRLAIKSGLLGKDVIGADAVRRLAELPGREVLLGQLAGTLNFSVAQLAGTLQGAVQKLATGLDAYRQKLEAAGSAPASA